MLPPPIGNWDELAVPHPAPKVKPIQLASIRKFLGATKLVREPSQSYNQFSDEYLLQKV